jgi:hypothetical protein
MAGGVSSRAYFEQVQSEIRNLQLEHDVRVFEKLPDEDVYALFRTADLYVSLSHHEGFGVPLVKAMTFELPVLALAAGAIPSTRKRVGCWSKQGTPVCGRVRGAFCKSPGCVEQSYMPNAMSWNALSASSWLRACKTSTSTHRGRGTRGSCKAQRQRNGGGVLADRGCLTAVTALPL